MEKLWTTPEVARFLGVTELEVEALVRHGHLTGYRLGGRFLRFRPDEVEAFKGAARPRLATGSPRMRRPQSWMNRARDFLYFYDFYLVSATLLAVLVLYLIAS